MEPWGANVNINGDVSIVKKKSIPTALMSVMLTLYMFVGVFCFGLFWFVCLLQSKGMVLISFPLNLFSQNRPPPFTIKTSREKKSSATILLIYWPYQSVLRQLCHRVHGFFVIYRGKLNISDFWKDGQTKQAIWITNL